MLQDQQIAQEDEYSLPYHHLSRYSPSFTTGFIDSWAMNYNHTLELVLKYLDRERPPNIVDIGCGDGRLTKEIGERFRDTRVLGVDYSERAVALARLMDPGGDYLSVDISEGEIGESFEFGLLIEVFEHIPLKRARAFVQGVAKTICHDGLLLVTVPHVNKPLERTHFRHFTEASLCGCFADYFVPHETIYIEKIGLLNHLLNRLVVNELFVLNHKRLLDLIYRAYGRYVFSAAAERECARVAVLFRRSQRPA